MGEYAEYGFWSTRLIWYVCRLWFNTIFHRRQHTISTLLIKPIYIRCYALTLHGCENIFLKVLKRAANALHQLKCFSANLGEKKTGQCRSQIVASQSSIVSNVSISVIMRQWPQTHRAQKWFATFVRNHERAPMSCPKGLLTLSWRFHLSQQFLPSDGPLLGLTQVSEDVVLFRAQFKNST